MYKDLRMGVRVRLSCPPSTTCAAVALYNKQLVALEQMLKADSEVQVRFIFALPPSLIAC